MIPEDPINVMIDECKLKIKHHRVNARSSLNWYNLLSIVSVIAVTIQALSLTILSVKKIDDVSLAIISGVFSCIIAIIGRVQGSFQFNVLNVLHDHSADSFLDIKTKLSELRVVFDRVKYDQILIEYQCAVEKEHIQTVRQSRCMMFLC